MQTLEVEISRQVKALHSSIQRDLDLLHEQVHGEVYSALSAELVSVAQNLTAIRAEAHKSFEDLRNSGGALEENCETMMTLMERMRSEMDMLKSQGDSTNVDLQKLRDNEFKAVTDGIQTSLAQAQAYIQEEIAGLRSETESALEASSAGVSAELPEDFVARVAELEAKLPQIEKDTLDAKESLSAEAAERATRAGELAMAVELSRAEARQSAEQLEASIRAIVEEAAARERQIQEKSKEAERLTQEEFRRTKTLFADMEKRLEEQDQSVSADLVAKASEATKSVESRLANLAREVEIQFDDARKDIRQLNEQCQEGLGFAHNCWTRTVDWMASVELAELDSTGRFEVESPRFMAAGLRDLQLRLRLASIEKPNGQARCICGVFLRGSVGQVSFRLTAAGKGQSFAGDFTKTSEWGSPKIVTLESVGPAVPIRLEILDVTAEVPPQIGAPAELISTFQMTDAARVAVREADKVRSSMVKRIEWRILHVSERIAAARAAVAAGRAEQEALEPLLSPTFAAGGLEGLQLQLYPLGYLRRDDAMPSSNFEEKCGFFLVCPRGVYMKCRAFVGDQVKVFEHQYAEKEPFGRAGFCRLIDKAGNDDCVVCGVEILDVRQELTTQIKGGPYGGMVDQMKVTLAPSLGSMEIMRELRDAGDKGSWFAKYRPPANQGYPSPTAASLVPIGPSMVLHNAHSLPALLPDGASAKAAAVRRNRGDSDGRSGGSWPPSPGSPSPAKQKTRLPRI